VARDITLRRVEATSPLKVRIAPGTFARQAYHVPLPTHPGESVEVALADAPQQRVTLRMNQASPELTDKTSPVVTESGRVTPPSGPKTLKTDFIALEFFREHFFPHEPMYFLMGWENPNVKFQLSFKYRMLNGDQERPGWLVRKVPALTNLYLGYTQTSLWDISAPSSPFYDTSYKPEFFYQWQRVNRHRWADWFTMDIQGGFQHASNGQDGDESRSMNVAYLMPTFYLGNTDQFYFRLAPRIYGYIGGMDENPDLADYYGHVQLRAMLGWADGVQLSVIGTIGNEFDHGSAQLDLTYPLFRLNGRNLAVYLDLQYFTGYGESLLDYDEYTSAFRAGFSLWR